MRFHAQIWNVFLNTTAATTTLTNLERPKYILFNSSLLQHSSTHSYPFQTNKHNNIYNNETRSRCDLI